MPRRGGIYRMFAGILWSASGSAWLLQVLDNLAVSVTF